MRPEVRPSVASDFDAFDVKLPYRVRAWTGVLGDEVIGIGGIAFLLDGTTGAFLLAKDKAREYPVTLHKTGLLVVREAKKLGITRLVALADPGVGAAERWLQRLGFEPIMVEQEKVWVCS